MRRVLVMASAAGLLVGCKVGPEYRPPATTMPAEFSAASTTRPAIALDRWWDSFHDAQLTQLIERAAGANLDVRLAEARVREARAIRGFAQAELWPIANATGSYSRQRISENEPIIGSLKPPTPIPFENDVYQAGFDAAWEIDLFGGRRRAVEAATAEVQATEAQRQDLLVSLTAEVARAYVEVRAAQRRLGIAKENIRLQQDVLELSRLRYEEGLTSELDVTRAAALLASTQSQIPALEERERRTMHQLAVLLGQWPGALVEELSAEKAMPVTPPEVPTGLPSDLLRRRPDVRQAERNLAAQTARIGAEMSELWPKFSLTGNVGLRSIDTDTFLDPESRFFSVGPAFRWRLLDFGRISSRVKAQNARQEAALAGYEKAVLSSLRDVEDALTAYAKEQIRRRAIEREVAEDARSVETANQLYTQGQVSFLEVADAMRALYQAQDRLVQSEQTLAGNVIALYKGLGGGWEAFEPGAHAATAEKATTRATEDGGRR